MGQSSERGIDLVGEAAVKWFASHAIVALPHPKQPPRVVADVLTGLHLSITRVWHSPLKLTRGEIETNGSAVRLVLVLDGETQITIGEDSFALNKHDLILFSDSAKRVFSSEAASARVEITFSTAATLHPHFDDVMRKNTILARSALSDVLAGVVTLVFSSGISSDDQGWPHLSRVLAEACAAALLFGSQRTRTSASSAEARIFYRAIDLIEELSARSDFSVKALAQKLGVSAPRLREVFAAHGITARDAVRLSRSARASRLISKGNFTSREDLERIADAAGFPSARTMSAALRREREELG